MRDYRSDFLNVHVFSKTRFPADGTGTGCTSTTGLSEAYLSTCTTMNQRIIWKLHLQPRCNCRDGYNCRRFAYTREWRLPGPERRGTQHVPNYFLAAYRERFPSLMRSRPRHNDPRGRSPVVFHPRNIHTGADISHLGESRMAQAYVCAHKSFISARVKKKNRSDIIYCVFFINQLGKKNHVLEEFSHLL